MCEYTTSCFYRERERERERVQEETIERKGERERERERGPVQKGDLKNKSSIVE